MNRKNLKVPYKDKDKARSLGAKWDPLERTWYIDRSNMKSIGLTTEELNRFKRWLAPVEPSKIVDFTPTKWCPAYKG